ncbi:helix-turn-helix domain-containing protein [Virgibacillus oceani]|uniref:AraC family transcriptional regulator n=1 Tax=Virgibacillus oceani TaxID=1479511 RepID=A0A917HAI4_9BACI|nr:AraC family transcriptional regulator [Virgibacillus oceani]GGG72725.1 AraC family transcriptional regulator [Virgibacillus oceani]
MILKLLAPPLPSFISGGEDTYEIGQHHPNRKGIGVFDLIVVTKGVLHISEDDARYQVNEKETLILYPDGHHYSAMPCNSETHFYWFHFITANKWTTISPELTNSQYKEAMHDDPFKVKHFSIRLPKHCTIVNWEKVEWLCGQIIDPSPELNLAWEFQQQLLFQELLLELAANQDADRLLPSVALAEKAAAYLRRNYTNKVSYQELGRVLQFHPNHIARCMIDVLGFGPNEYVNRYRIEQAKTLLIYTDWPIERIAEKCGFSQLAYFSRFFKKLEGVSPNRFRKMGKG